MKEGFLVKMEDVQKSLSMPCWSSGAMEGSSKAVGYRLFPNQDDGSSQSNFEKFNQSQRLYEESTKMLWIFLEKELKTQIPSYLKNLLNRTGFDNHVSIRDISQRDIEEIERFGREDMSMFVEPEDDPRQIYGIYYRNPGQFKIVPGHLKLIDSLKEACQGYDIEKFVEEPKKRRKNNSLSVSNVWSLKEPTYPAIGISLDGLPKTVKSVLDARPPSPDPWPTSPDARPETPDTWPTSLDFRSTSPDDQPISPDTSSVSQSTPMWRKPGSFCVTTYQEMEESLLHDKHRRQLEHLVTAWAKNTFTSVMEDHFAERLIPVYSNAQVKVECLRENEVIRWAGTIVCPTCKSDLRVATCPTRKGQRWIISNFVRHVKGHIRRGLGKFCQTKAELDSIYQCHVIEEEPEQRSTTRSQSSNEGFSSDEDMDG